MDGLLCYSLANPSNKDDVNDRIMYRAGRRVCVYDPVSGKQEYFKGRATNVTQINHFCRGPWAIRGTRNPEAIRGIPSVGAIRGTRVTWSRNPTFGSRVLEFESQKLRVRKNELRQMPYFLYY